MFTFLCVAIKFLTRPAPVISYTLAHNDALSTTPLVGSVILLFGGQGGVWWFPGQCFSPTLVQKIAV
jgi:hypothetical protein